MNLAERARATETVLARYRDRPFSWSGAHCVRLAREQGTAMGHALPPIPLFRTALGARRALRKRGWASVTEMLDQFFARLPAPAFMWVGDLCVLEGAEAHRGLEAVCIADGQGNLFGWHEDTDFRALETIKFADSAIAAAWRL